MKTRKTTKNAKNTKKFVVLCRISGPYNNPYVCTCKTLEKAQAAVYKHASKCYPHTVVKNSETDFTAYVKPSDTIQSHYVIDIR